MPPDERPRFTRARRKMLNLVSIGNNRLDVFDEARMVSGHRDVPRPVDPRCFKRCAELHLEHAMLPHKASDSRLARKRVQGWAFHVIDRDELFLRAGFGTNPGTHLPALSRIDPEEGDRRM